MVQRRCPRRSLMFMCPATRGINASVGVIFDNLRMLFPPLRDHGAGACVGISVILTSAQGHDRLEVQPAFPVTCQSSEAFHTESYFRCNV